MIKQFSRRSSIPFHSSFRSLITGGIGCFGKAFIAESLSSDHRCMHSTECALQGDQRILAPENW